MADTEHYGSLGALAPAWDEGERNIAVSYTHLTLPTIA